MLWLFEIVTSSRSASDVAITHQIRLVKKRLIKRVCKFVWKVIELPCLVFTLSKRSEMLSARGMSHECCRISMEERLSLTGVSLVWISCFPVQRQIYTLHTYVHMRANIHCDKTHFYLRKVNLWTLCNCTDF